MLDTQQPIPKPATWESEIIIPLTQNLAGGIASTLLLAMLTYAWNNSNHLANDLNNILTWSGLAGASVTSLATLIRFFADDVGLISAAYKAGQRSRDEEMQRLNRQISILEQQPGKPPPAAASEINQRLGKMKGDYDNAKRLITILLDGGNISRNSGEHDLTQRPWERAVSLIEKAKVYQHSDRQLLITSRSEAMKTLTEFFKEQLEMANNTAFQPAWW